MSWFDDVAPAASTTVATDPTASLGDATFATQPFSFPAFQGPAPFVAPTQAEAAADPGYQFALQQGETQLENSRSAQGVLRSSNTLQDILNYGQQAAATQYGNVYQRDIGAYAMNYQDALASYSASLAGANSTFSNNFNLNQATFNRLYTLATFGQNATGIPVTATSPVIGPGTAPAAGSGVSTPNAASPTSDGTMASLSQTPTTAPATSSFWALPPTFPGMAVEGAVS